MKGAGTMSWLFVFISSFFPIVLLFALLAVDWLQREAGSRPSSLRLQKCEEKRTRGRG
jgi:hypothetical protein